MSEIFAKPLAEVSTEDVLALLAGSAPEPLLWEAKGGEPNPHEIRRQCGAFANANAGGMLILGADERSGRWHLAGMTFPDGEPHRYVSDCLRDGVRPQPRFDVRALELAEGRYLVLIAVSPLQDGPCIVRGTVYERVPGATVSVKDPGRLAELYGRGRRAHSDALAAANQAMGQAIVAFPDTGFEDNDDYESWSLPDEYSGREIKSLYVAVSIATVDRGPDVNARLFRSSTRELMAQLALALSDEPPPLTPDVAQWVGQDRRVVTALSPRDDRADWAVSAFWTGAVAIGYRGLRHHGSPSALSELVISPAVEAALAVVQALAGGDIGYVRTAVVDLHQRHPVWPSPIQLSRGPVGLGPVLDFASIGRELSRAAGVDAPEPE